MNANTAAILSRRASALLTPPLLRASELGDDAAIRLLYLRANNPRLAKTVYDALVAAAQKRVLDNVLKDLLRTAERAMKRAAVLRPVH
jgi:hypothetical protein